MDEEYEKLDLDTLFHGNNMITNSSSHFSWPANSGSTYNNYYVTTSPNTASPNTQLPNYTFTNSFNNSPSIKCDGDIECNGKLKVKGTDITEVLATIEKRLAILIPDPVKLEKFEALRKAYENYKMLEALCYTESTDEKS